MKDTAARLKEELEFAETWRPAPGFEGFAPLEQLLRNEFADPRARERTLLEQLRGMLQYAAQEIPFYRSHWRGHDPARLTALRDLERWPEISRHDVVAHFDALRAPQVPLDSKQVFTSRTSGSTGLPVKVLQTVSDLQMFALLWQRQARWFRFDVSGRLARIRTPKHLFRRPGGAFNPDGQSISRPRWSYAGEFFITGDEVHFNLSNPRPEQLRWLDEQRPDYLLTFPPLLEELALANDSRPLPGLRGVVAVASMLTEAMRGRIEQAFRVPVNQSYGLNEFGMVATRCPAGRYHTHVENALVEIVDDEGRAVPEGASGRLLVTSLVNRAMPLIRYDTGDLARAGAGLCECGRTLPSFEDVLGRYVRYAGTPEGTRERLHCLLDVVGKMPNEMFVNIRQYQFYQTLEEDFEIRVRAAGPLHEDFAARLQAAWRKANESDPGRQLRIVEVGEIEATPSGKQLDFVSAFQETDVAFSG